MHFFSSSRLGNNEWHLYLLGVLATLGGYFIGQLPLTLALVYKVSSRTDIGTSDLESFQDDMDFTKFGMDKNLGFFLMVLIFVFAMAGLFLAAKIHGKKFIRWITPTETIDWERVKTGAIFWGALIGLSELITYFINPSVYSCGLDWVAFLPLLLIALLFLPIQTSFEEIFFRGYIMQALSLGTKNKLVVIAVSSVLFALMHAMNPEVGKFGWGIMMAYYFSAGAFLALITVMDNRLELALGVHAATNILGATLVTYSGSVLQTDTICKVSEIKPELMLLFFYVTAVVFYVFCARKYQWATIQSLWTPIEYGEDNEMKEIQH